MKIRHDKKRPQEHDSRTDPFLRGIDCCPVETDGQDGVFWKLVIAYGDEGKMTRVPIIITSYKEKMFIG